MHKLWVIAHREYVAMVGTKAFVFTLVMMPILMFGSLLIMPLVNQVSSGKNRKIVIADATGALFQAIARSASLRNEAIEKLAATEPDESIGGPSTSANRGGFMGQASDTWEFSETQAPLTEQQRLELSQRLRSGELYAFVELPDGLLDLPKEPAKSEANEQGEAPLAVSIPKFYSQDALINEVRGWLGGVINQEARLTRLKQAGLDNLDPTVFAKIDAKIELAPSLPMQASDKGKSGNTSAMDSLIAMFLPFGVMMLMFMVILMAAQPMLESAMEEKNLRISELLLGSVTPAQLMGGKLLGNVAGSLIIFVLYGSGGLFLLNSQSLTDKLPVSVLPWFLLFQLLGVLFFSSIFLTVGASVNELKEAQSLLLPVWMVLMMPMMVWFIAIRDPNGPVATTLSFFPPSCPMMMVLRLASGTTVPYWQPPLAALIMVVSTYLIVRTAGHIYRAGLLRNEGVRSITQLFRRSFSS
jgi:ABC-2 type transport system permease protein